MITIKETGLGHLQIVIPESEHFMMSNASYGFTLTIYGTKIQELMLKPLEERHQCLACGNYYDTEALAEACYTRERAQEEAR